MSKSARMITGLNNDELKIGAKILKDLKNCGVNVTYTTTPAIGRIDIDYATPEFVAMLKEDIAEQFAAVQN